MYIPLTLKLCNAFACGGNTTYYSNSFKLGFGSTFGIWYKAASSGTIALQIQLEESYQPPTTENASDSGIWAVPSTLNDIVTALANNTLDMKTISPIPMPYARLKIIGGASNDATTTLTSYVFIQEQG